ncbi:hypothetical protein [Parasitella parasitica]|uniref:Guanylyl cyclase n=1 Tax=Parasitella parasitica TaxID=35722 RepID=A0A0B7N412_9FUNG|nr:hypothetical protein [Parasitella parasitica]
MRMLSLGTDDNVNSANDTIINYSEFSDHPIPHIVQQTKDTNWDCGLACIVMTLRGLGFNVNLEDMARQCPVNSVWTIDLAFLLRNYVHDFTYYTSYLGSRKEYQDQKFYQDDFDEDEKRVNKLMLPLDDYKRFLYCKKFAIITLVNARLLKCQLCRRHRGCLGSVCGQLDVLLERFKGNEYLGHFVVLIGYDPTEDLFIYRDPAASDEFCTISADDLDEARQSEGTDHDW